MGTLARWPPSAGSPSTTRCATSRSRPSRRARVAGSVDGRNRFLVQRHRARRLHYDLRFEVDGVLVSWAVPQGSEPRPEAQVAGRQGRGPPVRLRLVRGHHPERLRQGRRHPVGRRLVGARPRVPGRADGGQGDRSRRAQVRPRRAQAARPLRDRAHRASRATDDDQWLLMHKKDDDAVPGGIPRTTRSRCSARARTRTSPPAGRAAGRRRRRTSWPRSTSCPSAKGGSGPSAASPQQITNLDKVMMPGRGRAADHQARHHRLLRHGRAVDDDVADRPADQPQPLPRRHRRRQGRLLPQGGAGPRPAVGAPLAEPARRARARPASTC